MHGTVSRRLADGISPRPPFAWPSPKNVLFITAANSLRPWNFFLIASAVGRNASDPEPKHALIVAPFQREPRKWAALEWRFAESGDPIPFDRPDARGTRWHVRTIGKFLSDYARHSVPQMLAPDGSRCGPFTRGVLQRRPVRDGERWLLLKEAAVWGDDPHHAFSTPEPEMVRAGRSTDFAEDWEGKIKPALAVVSPTAVARKMGLAERSARAWAAGARQPENPSKVARAIVAVAQEAGLGLPADEHHRAEEICGDLPLRAAAVQCFILNP